MPNPDCCRSPFSYRPLVSVLITIMPLARTVDTDGALTQSKKKGGHSWAQKKATATRSKEVNNRIKAIKNEATKQALKLAEYAGLYVPCL